MFFLRRIIEVWKDFVYEADNLTKTVAVARQWWCPIVWLRAVILLLLDKQTWKLCVYMCTSVLSRTSSSSQASATLEVALSSSGSDSDSSRNGGEGPDDVGTNYGQEYGASSSSSSILEGKAASTRNTTLQKTLG